MKEFTLEDILNLLPEAARFGELSCNCASAKPRLSAPIIDEDPADAALCCEITVSRTVIQTVRYTRR